MWLISLFSQRIWHQPQYFPVTCGAAIAMFKSYLFSVGTLSRPSHALFCRNSFQALVAQEIISMGSTRSVPQGHTVEPLLWLYSPHCASKLLWRAIVPQSYGVTDSRVCLSPACVHRHFTLPSSFLLDIISSVVFPILHLVWSDVPFISDLCSPTPCGWERDDRQLP